MYLIYYYNRVIVGGVLDIQRGVCHFLKQFREGNFGRITF